MFGPVFLDMGIPLFLTLEKSKKISNFIKSFSSYLTSYLAWYDRIRIDESLHSFQRKMLWFLKNMYARKGVRYAGIQY